MFSTPPKTPESAEFVPEPKHSEEPATDAKISDSFLSLAPIEPSKTTEREYKIILNKQALQKIITYKEKLAKDQKDCKDKKSTQRQDHRFKIGEYLKLALKGLEIDKISLEDFIAYLVNTKKPKIYAESEVEGDATDWNQEELAILGDINIAAPVTIFDDGNHHHPTVHPTPFFGTLLFTPGALLRNDMGKMVPDRSEVIIKEELDEKAYFKLYERRLLPLLLEANLASQKAGKKAFITIPGIGCGQFAGDYARGIHAKFQKVLERLLLKNGHLLKNIGMVYFDPYNQCAPVDKQINGIHFRVRLKVESNGHPQLCHPSTYQEKSDDFNEKLFMFFSFVAWDQVSWPGNDYYGGHRSTDDGVKAAATDLMYVMTGIRGEYCKHENGYKPLDEFSTLTWGEIIEKRKISLNSRGKIYIQTQDKGQRLIIKKLSGDELVKISVAETTESSIIDSATLSSLSASSSSVPPMLEDHKTTPQKKIPSTILDLAFKNLNEYKIESVINILRIFPNIVNINHPKKEFFNSTLLLTALFKLNKVRKDKSQLEKNRAVTELLKLIQMIANIPNINLSLKDEDGNTIFHRIFWYAGKRVESLEDSAMYCKIGEYFFSQLKNIEELDSIFNTQNKQGDTVFKNIKMLSNSTENEIQSYASSYIDSYVGASKRKEARRIAPPIYIIPPEAKKNEAQQYAFTLQAAIHILIDLISSRAIRLESFKIATLKKIGEWLESRIIAKNIEDPREIQLAHQIVSQITSPNKTRLPFFSSKYSELNDMMADHPIDSIDITDAELRSLRNIERITDFIQSKLSKLATVTARR